MEQFFFFFLKEKLGQSTSQFFIQWNEGEMRTIISMTQHAC